MTISLPYLAGRTDFWKKKVEHVGYPALLRILAFAFPNRKIFEPPETADGHILILKIINSCADIVLFGILFGLKKFFFEEGTRHSFTIFVISLNYYNVLQIANP
ncbi:MAG: hypothetical protein OHK0053_29410 [Microscillaceae bacterium]